MRQSVLTRAVIFAIAIIAALIYLVPTFVGSLPSWWTNFLPADRINLGLDLQGGSHLVLGVKVDKAIENNIERVRGDLTNVLREKGVSGVNVDLTPEFAAKLGAALGATLPKGSYVAINRDIHRSSRMLKRALISGLPGTGINVWDTGTVAIPVVRYFVRKEPTQPV